jgi:acyl-CoA synthetase (AMP-forming)/AMP-acid ligase II
VRLLDQIEQAWRRAPDRVAFVDGDERYTWRDVERLSAGYARAWLGRGVGARSHVAVLSPNDALAFAAVIAVIRLGAVWVPVNYRNAPEANQHLLRTSRCECLVFHPALEAEARALEPALEGRRIVLPFGAVPGAARLPVVGGDPGRTVSVFPTGGTTGLSKAAEWTERTWDALIAAFDACLPAPVPPVHLVAGPMTHAAGVLALCMSKAAPTHVILKRASPELILEAIPRHRVTHLFLPPTLIYMLLAHPDVARHDYSSLRHLITAAAPIAPAKLREAMRVFGPVVCQSFGQAEAPMFLTFLATSDLLARAPGAKDDRYASCGRPTPGMDVQVMDDDGHLVGPYQRGEIVARGPLLMQGYYENAESSRAAIRGGWLHTGDVGYRDADGFFYIVDRKKDMIVTGGFNVFSAEVEQVILAHPAVRECAVIGVPDEKWGEAVKAIVELKDGCAVDAAVLVELVRSRLGGVHAPKSVEIRGALPRNANGKVLKRELRAEFWADRARQV